MRQADVHRRLPGGHRHPALHPPPAGARPRRRAGGDQRSQPVPFDLRARLPAGDRSARASASRQEDGVGGDRAAGALRRRPRPAGKGGTAAASKPSSAGSPSSAPARPASPPPPTWCATAPTSPSTRRCTCVGGVLRYGIPSFRLPRDIIDREVQQPEGHRASSSRPTRSSARPSPSPSCMGEMGFDAVFVGAGAGAPSFLGIPGEFAGQVYSANEFLTRVNLMGGDQFPYLDTPIGLGKQRGRHRRRQHRDGLPARGEAARRADRALRLPPLRGRGAGPHRGAAARQGGRHRVLLPARARSRSWTDDDGDVRGMKVQKMKLGEPDEKGRRKPLPTGEFVELECDTVIYALGTNANPIVTQVHAGARRSTSGATSSPTSATQATNLPGVFAGGDIVTGGATVILAMGAGRRAARAIGAYLQAARASGRSPPRMPTPSCRRRLDGADAGLRRSSEVAAWTSIRSQPCLPEVPPPIEGDEPYVCCAGAELQWRCSDCGKVSEGFAFPYGMCPHLRRQARVLDTRRDRGRRARSTPSARRSRSSSAAGPSTRAPRDQARSRCCGTCSAGSPRWRTSTWRRCRGATTPSAGRVRGVPGRSRGDLRRHRTQARGSGEPVPHRHRASRSAR